MVSTTCSLLSSIHLFAVGSTLFSIPIISFARMFLSVIEIGQCLNSQAGKLQAA